MNPKKGLAFVVTGPDIVERDRVLLGGKHGAAWWYAWSPTPPMTAEQSNGALFVPMLWSDNEHLWDILIANYPSTYDGPILFLNEPNHPDQADILPVDAAKAFHRLRLLFPLAQIVAPACWDRSTQDTVTEQWSLDSAHWLLEWREAYYRLYQTYPDVFAYALHYYNDGLQPATACRRFYEWVQKYDQRLGIKVILTEWRLCNEMWDRVANYDLAAHFRHQVREMEAFDWLWGWAYFANAEYPDDPYVSNADCHIALKDKDGLTPLGLVYVSL